MSDLSEAADAFHQALVTLTTAEGSLPHRLAQAARGRLAGLQASDGSIPGDTAQRIASIQQRLAGSDPVAEGLESLDGAEARALAEYLLEVGLEVESEYRRAAGDV